MFAVCQCSRSGLIDVDMRILRRFEASLFFVRRVLFSSEVSVETPHKDTNKWEGAGTFGALPDHLT